MDELKRYALSSAGRMFPDSNGGWVFHESARAALDSLKAQLATEREAHARTLAALKLRGCDFHEFKADGWTACAAEMPLDQKGWCRTCAAIAAAEVTP